MRKGSSSCILIRLNQSGIINETIATTKMVKYNRLLEIVEDEWWGQLRRYADMDGFYSLSEED